MKVDNYGNKLVEFANSVRGLDFEWGKTDCATLVCHGLYVILDKYPFTKKTLPQWDNKNKAIRRFLRVGDIGKFLIDQGAVEVHMDYAGTGDVILSPGLDDNDLPRLAMMLPTRRVLLSTPKTGVIIEKSHVLVDNTRYYRYE